jgi:hypothetical protein
MRSTPLLAVYEMVPVNTEVLGAKIVTLSPVALVATVPCCTIVPVAGVLAVVVVVVAVCVTVNVAVAL